MRILFAALGLMIFSGCMYVRIEACGTGSVTVNLDKAVSTMPLDLKAHDVTVPVIP